MGKTYEAALTFEVTWISPDDPSYDVSSDDYVVSQYPSQGALVFGYPTGQITVIGSNNPSYVPEYAVENCDSVSSCITFANSKGISYTTQEKTDTAYTILLDSLEYNSDFYNMIKGKLKSECDSICDGSVNNVYAYPFSAYMWGSNAYVSEDINELLLGRRFKR